MTGQPYVPNVVNLGDFTRALTEFWADGPKSETPPGHWNVVANAVSDSPGFELRIGGAGPEVDRLKWDVKLYLALNGRFTTQPSRRGGEGVLRLGAADLDDPVWAGSDSRATPMARPTTRAACPRGWPRSR